MTIDDLNRILEMVREHALVEFELEQDGVRLRIRKDSIHAPGPVAAQALVSAPAAAVVPQPTAPVAVPVASASPGEAIDEPIDLAVVKSPIVGTFYRAPSPGAPSFVELGTRVKKGQILCIIEAMKLMNEIEGEYDGEIVKIYVDNGQPVQYGERLFAIKPS